DRALKAIPNGALLSRLQVVEGGPQKIGHRRSVEFPTKNQYDEGVEDARAHELIRVGILDDVVDRTRIAIENIRLDPVAGFSGGVAKNELDIWPAKEPRQRAIRRLLPPLAKQMERDEQSVLFNLARRLVSIDGLQQQRRHHRPGGGRRPDRLGRQALAGTQLVKDLHRTVLPVHSNVASISQRSMIAEGTSVENCASRPKSTFGHSSAWIDGAAAALDTPHEVGHPFDWPASWNSFCFERHRLARRYFMQMAAGAATRYIARH